MSYKFPNYLKYADTHEYVKEENGLKSIWPTTCPHEGAKMDKSCIVKSRILCPWHHRRIDRILDFKDEITNIIPSIDFCVEKFQDKIRIYYRNDPEYYNKHSRMFEEPNFPESSDIPKVSSTLSDIMFQGRDNGTHPVPPLIRQVGFDSWTNIDYEWAARRSKAAQWISNSKIYKIQIEKKC